MQVYYLMNCILIIVIWSLNFLYQKTSPKNDCRTFISGFWFLTAAEYIVKDSRIINGLVNLYCTVIIFLKFFLLNHKQRKRNLGWVNCNSLRRVTTINIFCELNNIQNSCLPVSIFFLNFSIIAWILFTRKCHWILIYKLTSAYLNLTQTHHSFLEPMFFDYSG